jgi:hypothetical protein
VSSQVVMYDAVDISQIPAGPPAVAGYVDGAYPTAAALAARFPHAKLLTIAVSAAGDADALDIENGDATPGDVPAWHERQQARGVQRPCLYASVSLMQAQLIPVLKAAGIPRTAVRLWTAHYAGLHLCAPSTCGELSTAADGTQWTSRAFGRALDESLLAADFFAVTAPPSPQPASQPASEDDEMPSGTITVPRGVRESHSWLAGTAGQLVLASDWEGVQDTPPVVAVRLLHLQDAVTDAGSLTVNRTATAGIADPPQCNGCSLERVDAGAATVSWHVNPPAKA